jgi:hypothetical protein
MKPCNTARNIGSRKNFIAPFESVCSENTAFVAMSKSVRSYFKNYEFIVSKENNSVATQNVKCVFQLKIQLSCLFSIFNR